MPTSPGRRACSLVMALALLVAPALPGASIRDGCRACRPGCPMHARRLGCHHASRLRCHRAPLAAGVRSACGHAADVMAAPGGLRAIMPKPGALTSALAARGDVPPVAALVTQHLLEPPTDPPRAPRA